MAELRHQISINAAPEQVFAALATSGGLRGWWTADSTADTKVSGKAEFGFNNRQVMFRMTIEELEPGKRVVWRCHGDSPEWIGTTLTWDIAPTEGGSVLRFSQNGWQSMSEMYALCNTTWGELMYRMKLYLEGGNPGPHWTE
jgi:uncharacterized protein YndB with AHSA1/START domain